MSLPLAVHELWEKDPDKEDEEASVGGGVSDK